MPVMGAEYEVDELGALRKRPVIKNTYGKGLRKRQPKAAFMPVTASESMSEDDPIISSNATISRNQPPSVSSPRSKVPSARLKGLNARDARTMPASFQEIASSDRKRKVSQIYKSRERSQPAAEESEEDRVPYAPEPRRSRITQPEPVSNAKSNGGEHSHSQQNSSESDTVRPRLSSPPPTPPSASKSASVGSASQQKSPNKSSKERAPEHSPQRRHPIPLHLARDSSKKTKQTTTKSAGARKQQPLIVSVDKKPGSSRPKPPRKRLIDVLVEQEEEDDATILDEDALDNQIISSQSTFSQATNTSEFDNQGLLETPRPRAKTAPAPGPTTFTRSNSALKFTYGQGRTVLEEEDSLLESLALPEGSSYSRRRLDLEGYKKSSSVMGPFDYGNDDGTTNGSPGSKLRDIYELRQAGANSRVADAMQDLIDQIGEPGGNSSSSRRTALFQVAENMRDKVYIQRCRDHGVENTLLKDMAKEIDPICEYLIMSSLVAILAKSPSAHVCGLLRTEQPGPMFARLLNISEDIKKLAKDRKSNLSKRNQNMIAVIESQLQKLPIWDGSQPSFISPRSLTTKCLQLLIAQDVLMSNDARVFSEAVTRHLFQVLSDASNNTEFYDYPKTAQSVELCSTLSVLNVHAVSMATTRGDDGEPITRYFPIIADVLYASLQMPKHEDKTVEDLILKLTINLTNNNLAAPGIFAEKGLLPALAASISSNLSQALTFISQDISTEGTLNSLYLQLGILINFAEHSELVRRILNDCQYENRDLVKELIQLFIDNHYRTSEADSIQKTHLNVAFGYLSVLLGYLALHKPVRQKLARSHSAKTIRPLIGSIREFVAHYKQVESAIDETDGDDGHHGGYTERLQELVQQLEIKSVHD
ncbi:wings apart-like protein regulation of heterochromatin-domain-containing protein [Xylaria nigripes]|nr:wings apart-like protein regulation of heterochromatin-domain-containing protein [Xylaria nigripes]